MPNQSRLARRNRRIMKRLDAIGDAINQMREAVARDLDVHSCAANLARACFTFVLFLQELSQSPNYPPFSRKMRKKAVLAQGPPRAKTAGMIGFVGHQHHEKKDGDYA